MAATVEVTWEDVLSSIDNLLMETEIQDTNSDLEFHEVSWRDQLKERNKHCTLKRLTSWDRTRQSFDNKCRSILSPQ